MSGNSKDFRNDFSCCQSGIFESSIRDELISHKFTAADCIRDVRMTIFQFDEVVVSCGAHSAGAGLVRTFPWKTILQFWHSASMATENVTSEYKFDLISARVTHNDRVLSSASSAMLSRSLSCSDRWSESSTSPKFPESVEISPCSQTLTHSSEIPGIAWEKIKITFYRYHSLISFTKFNYISLLVTLTHLWHNICHLTRLNWIKIT